MQNSFKVDYATENEEWLAQYKKVEASLEDIALDGNEKADWLVAATMVVRAGRLGLLQSALVDDTEENAAAVENLLFSTRQEMDQAAASSKQIQLLDQIMAGATQNSPFLSDTKIEKEDICTNVDVDAFFEEYSECVKSDWEQLFSEPSDDEDESVNVVEKRPRMESKSTQTQHQQLFESDGNFRKGPLSSDERPPQTQYAPFSDGNPQQRLTETSHAINNPYCKTGKNVSTERHDTHKRNQPGGAPTNSFSYTPASQLTVGNSSWDRQNVLRTNTNANNSSRGRPNARPPSSTFVSNKNASWEDHQNQQNPFQTARELAQVQNPPTGKQRGQENHHDSWHQKQSNNPYQNPYQNPQQSGHSNYPSNTADDEAPIRGGPAIPDSLKRKFQPPKRTENIIGKSGNSGSVPVANKSKGGVQVRPPRPTSSSSRKADEDDDELPEELQHLDKELVKKIQNEIMESGDTITFDDIAGLDDAKQTVQEVVCWPMKRPDLFTGLRRAPNGLLLYGPPGTGKTLIGKAIAYESGATFFSISSSSLTSKWIGEGEKLVRTLFAVAAYREPAVVFIDEIDSLLTQRKATENEASRRIKTEFLVQLDGTGTSGQGRVLVIGATNRPQELDEAARRRFTKRLYIPLPAENDRRVLLNVMLKKNNHRLTEADVDKLAKETNGFSGADLKALCTDAAMGPIRQLGSRALEINIKDVPPISFKHFKRSLKGTRPSVAPQDLIQYEEWDKIYGSKRADEEDDDDDSSDGE